MGSGSALEPQENIRTARNGKIFNRTHGTEKLSVKILSVQILSAHLARRETNTQIRFIDSIVYLYKAIRQVMLKIYSVAMEG